MAQMLARTALLISGSLAMSIAVKMTIVLVMAFAATSVLGRSRASLRHAVLASLFGILLLLPAASVIVPPLDIHIARPAIADAGPDVLTAERKAGRATAVSPVPRAAVGQPGAFVPSMEHIFLAVWVLGAAVLLVPLAAGFWKLRLIRRCGAPWRDGVQLLAALAAGARIRRPVEARLHEDVLAPMTCGARRPLVLLPTTVHEWAPHEVEQALIHELEHVRRLDWVVRVGSRAVCAMYWWHPMVWVAWRRLNVEAERACDDAVLADAEATAYAEQLVGLARRMTGGTRPALGMISRSDLSARVAAVLDAGQPRGRVGLFRIAQIAAAAVMLLMTLAPIRATSARGSQRPAPNASPTFDVASVKPNRSGDVRTNFQMFPGGRFVATNLPLRALVMQAWRLQMFEVDGGPDWIISDRFDIAATAPEGTTADQVRLMLRAMLAERFKLHTHTEKRQLSVYAMTLVRDGRLGPNVRSSTADCRQGEPVASGPVDRNNPPCGYIGPSSDSDFKSGYARMMFRGLTMDRLARFWVPALRRMVVNRTGLDGYFDGEFDPSAEFGPPPPPPGVPDPFDRDSLPSAFTVLREQLGLKMESTKAPVDVLIIDGAERPTPN